MKFRKTGRNVKDADFYLDSDDRIEQEARLIQEKIDAYRLVKR